MSAIAKAPRGAAKTTRLRKVSCATCGYTVRMSRSWMTVGLPACPCGAGELEPACIADLAYIGKIGPHDVAAREWTAICRENGWTDAIVRRGGAAKAHEAKTGGRLATSGLRADFCAYAGCGSFVPAGATRCAHHPATDEAMPF